MRVKVIREIEYTGCLQAIDRQLGNSLPDGDRVWGGIEIKVKTVSREIKKDYKLYSWVEYESSGGRNDYTGTYKRYMQAWLTGLMSQHDSGYINDGEDIDFLDCHDDYARYLAFTNFWNKYREAKKELEVDFDINGQFSVS